MAALGASAGGLEALEEFFDHMPPDAGIAFVVVQHLDPHRDSIAPDLLGRHTAMPVREASEGDVLLADHVYVTPPDVWMTVRESTLHMARREGRGPPTVVDRLFRSLAEDRGPGAAAILLSGAGSDGAVGIGRVRELGGLAMVQDPATARFDSMPRHGITVGRIRDILPPAGLARRLAEHVERVRRGEVAAPDAGSPEASEADATRIAEAITRATGHDFTEHKPATILRRLARRMKRRSVATIGAYLELLGQDPAEVRALYEDLLIGVTSFFREPEAFRALRDHVVSGIVADPDTEGAIRVWVAGCGTGQEAYSVAMLFREALTERADPPALKVFATDVNEDALAVARRGRYPQGISEEVPAELLERYFRPEGSELRVTEELRESCIFAPHDLLSDPPFSCLDLICCRNVLIYLRPRAQNRLFPLFHYALRPGGTLFLGTSESVTGHERLFREIPEGHHIYQRRETAVRLPLSLPARRSHDLGFGRGADAEPLRPWPVRSSLRRGSAVELERILLDEYTPPCVIVDADGTIVYFHGRTGAFLEPAPGLPSDDLIGMVRPGLRHQLRGALADAARTKETVAREIVAVDPGESWHHVDLTVRPMEGGAGDDEHYLVLFENRVVREARPITDAAGRTETRAGGTKTEAERIIEELERELTDTRNQLLVSLREQEVVNAELRAANEELISMNEELQSSNEELQTADEETQSINEELETVNTELSQRITELKHALSDLDNLFRSNEIATIFLDRQLQIQRFTPASTHVFRLLETDIGRPLADIASRIVGHGDEVLQQVRHVLETLEPAQREIRVDHEEAWYDMRIFPYRTIDGEIEGAVLTFVDITEIKRLQQARSRLGAIVEGMHDAVVGHDLDGTITSWNEGARRLFGYDAEEAVGQDLSLIAPPDRADDLDAAVEDVLRGGWTAPVETVLRTRDGGRIHVSINLSPIRDHAGQVIEISQTARDITARVKAAEAARDAERQKNEFLTMLGHELRNPLGTIRNSVEFLVRRAGGTGEGDDGASREALGVLTRQVGYLSDLVNDLTDAARMTTGQFDLRLERMDLAELVRHGLADYRGWAEELGVELTVELPAGPLWTEGDRTRLTQVLGNLVQNACKYSHDGGRVTVQARKEEPWALVSVRDEGPGLDEEELERIFELFQRGSRTRQAASGPGGLGVGLPVARRLVERHGGSLWATSDGDGKGSTFTFRIPLVDEGAPASPPSSPEPAAESPPRRVLVVEDDADAAASLKRLLEVMGHEAAVAHEADAARRMILEAPPDLVLCDIHLSGTLGGYELARALREDRRSADLRLVALTGFGREIDREQSREAGFDEHLTKPVSAADLERVLGD